MINSDGNDLATPTAPYFNGKLTWAPRFRRLLVGIDLTPSSARLARVGAELVSQHWLAKLTLVHVIPAQSPKFVELMVGAKTMPMRVVSAAQQLNELRTELPPEVEADCFIATGNETTELCRSAEKVGADLMLLSAGTPTNSPWARHGSVTEAVVHRAPCSVLVLKEPQEGEAESESTGTKRVLVAYDGSAGAAGALAAALQYAKRGLERLTLVRAVDPSAIVVPPYGDPRDGQRQLLEAREEVARALEQASPEVEVNFDVQIGTPWRVITEAAERCGADLVILGAGEPRGLTGFFTGTTPGRVVRHAHCSVLIVKPTR